ncbi:MAG: protein translocase component YidC [Deltaproteobacteria bacterium HGW-Deltaproteobacteria-13]|jgi:YidC/Oxa1 family membrane protein insertase|nr:MAG: protein translocase component YidC [Deltaproteobacteria bacterium HGW-Deltaproteobacteria-13]
MDKRTILAVVLSLAVLFAYQIFFAKPPAPPKAAPVQESKQVTSDTATAAKQQPATSAAVSAPKSADKPALAKKEEPPRDIKVETENYTAVFSTRGAALKSFQLKKYNKECTKCADDIYPLMKNFVTGKKQPAKEKSKELIELVAVKENMPYPLALTFPESDTGISADSVYDADAAKLDMTQNKQEQRLVFSRTFNGKIKIEKIFSFNPDNYSITLEVKVSNLTDTPLSQTPYLNWYEYVDPSQPVDSYSKEGPVAYVSKSIKRHKSADISTDVTVGPDVSWGGFERKYFMAVIIPQDPSLTSINMSKDKDNMVSVNLKETKSIIPPGQSGSMKYNLFIGPKDYTLLKKQGLSLEEAVEFDSFIPGLKWLSIGLLIFIKFLHQYISNYGVAIIILTILIKIIFWPLGNISYKSMKEMQKIQPKIVALKDKYKDDQAKLGQATMALYKEHKVNPLSGCLPILIQIPVFIGLYNTLLYAIELRQSPFFWWIQDLSAKDPYYITPIIMGATQFIQQKMTPTVGDPMQAKIMLIMPVVFTFIFLNFPAGLVIYWLLNNILSIGQQVYINKKLA